jgi:Tfp pilus assembly protein PilV
MMKLNKIKGQGLIEVLMTLLVIAGSVLALLSFQSYLAYSNGLANQQATATQLAVNQIETLRDYSTLAAYGSIASGASTVTGQTATYTVTWTVTAFNNPTYKTIDVSVTWTDPHGAAQTSRLTSMVSSLDPSYSATIMAL